MYFMFVGNNDRRTFVGFLAAASWSELTLYKLPTLEQYVLQPNKSMRIMNSCTAFGAWANDHQYYILKVRVSHLLISSLKTKHNHEGTSWTQASDKHTKYFWRWKNSTNISKFQIPFWPCCSAQRKKLFWGVFLSTT